MPSTNKITTEDIAKAGRTTLRGVRLWDNLNLFGSVGRDENGARVFTEEHLYRAKEIALAQMDGKTIPEIKRMTAADFNRSAISVRQFAEEMESETTFKVFDL